MRKQEFNSKLISLLPLDEVPVHVHRFAARAPCDSKGSECQCGIHTAEAASALRSRKTERAAKEKPTPISQIFFSTCCAWHPNSPPRPGEAPHPAPSPRKSVIRLHKKLPSAPLRAPRRFRNPKIGQQLGAQPTPRFRVMIEAMIEALIQALIEALIDPWPPFTFCCPQAIVDQEAEVSIPNLISLLPLDEVPVHAPLRRPRPLRFERLRVPVWNPYSRGRLSPAKSEDRKGGEGKTDANLTDFFSTCCAMRTFWLRWTPGYAG